MRGRVRAAVAENRDVVEGIFNMRKDQLGMAKLLGALFVMRFLAGQLSVKDVEQRCLQILGCSGGIVFGCPPEIAFDIDMPEDYRYAAAYAET